MKLPYVWAMTLLLCRHCWSKVFNAPRIQDTFRQCDLERIARTESWKYVAEEPVFSGNHLTTIKQVVLDAMRMTALEDDLEAYNRACDDVSVAVFNRAYKFVSLLCYSGYRSWTLPGYQDRAIKIEHMLDLALNSIVCRLENDYNVKIKELIDFLHTPKTVSLLTTKKDEFFRLIADQWQHYGKVMCLSDGGYDFGLMHESVITDNNCLRLFNDDIEPGLADAIFEHVYDNIAIQYSGQKESDLLICQMSKS